MYRLVFYDEGGTSEAEIAHYLSSIATKTVLDGLHFLFQTKDDYMTFYQLYFCDDFFAGLGNYYHTDDGTAGYEIFYRKLERMKEKMQDLKEYYTFDVLEERIFYFCICEMEFRYDLGVKEFSFINLKEEERAVRELISRFEYEPEVAREIVESVSRFHEMNLTEDEDENMFFWDDDYLFFFNDGFIAGIQKLLSAAGETMGYGYKYVVNIFEDIGLKAPILLIGTEYAHKLANEETMRRYARKMDSLWDAGGLSKEEIARENEELAEKYGIDVEDWPFN